MKPQEPQSHRSQRATNQTLRTPAASATAVSSNPSLTIASLCGPPRSPPESPGVARSRRSESREASRQARQETPQLVQQSRKLDLTDLTCIETTIAPHWLRPINLQNHRILINALQSTICAPAANQSPLRRVQPRPGTPWLHARNPSASLPGLPSTIPPQQGPSRQLDQFVHLICKSPDASCAGKRKSTVTSRTQRPSVHLSCRAIQPSPARRRFLTDQRHLKRPLSIGPDEVSTTLTLVTLVQLRAGQACVRRPRAGP